MTVCQLVDKIDGPNWINSEVGQTELNHLMTYEEIADTVVATCKAKGLDHLTPNHIQFFNHDFHIVTVMDYY